MEHLTRKERIKYLKENAQLEIQKKKANIKHADGIAMDQHQTTKALEEVSPDLEDKEEIEVTAIINTTNLMDSHGDVHLPGIWKKSLSENRNIMHLQEHKMEFDKIIADKSDLQAYVKTVSWKQLGFPYFEGKTQALVFDSTIRKNRNEYMFGQYAKGNVNNHSVGMQYVKIALALDDPDDAQYYEIWEKYIDQIANKELAEEKGYFYIVKEAKVIEGSAVPLGSNFATPTQSIKDMAEPFENTLQQLKSIVKPEPNPLDVFYKHLKL